MAETPHRVVVVGGGFGGLQAVRRLRRAPVEVTLIDRQNFSLFQPLMYQLATGGLSDAEIAIPLRSVLKRQRNARVVLAEVTGFDLDAREVHMGEHSEPYDTLAVAGGAQYSYFGNDEWHEHAPELKSLAGGLDIRNRILSAFEHAELESDPARRERLLTFVVVGGGPTGVEMAGQIAELGRDVLHRDFRSIDTRTVRVLLVEAGPRVLAEFPESLSQKAARALEDLGVTVLVDHSVVDITADSVGVREGDGEVSRTGTETVIWAAGVNASPLAGLLAEAAGAEVDRAGRITVEADLSVPGRPEVFALGDMVRVKGGDGSIRTLPGVAPVAIQQGRYAAKVITKRLKGARHKPFRYVDKGNLATIGRSKAVADIKGIHLWGFPAWALWLMIHLFYLLGAQNRLLVMVRWTGSFVTRGRGARLIIGQPRLAS